VKLPALRRFASLWLTIGANCAWASYLPGATAAQTSAFPLERGTRWAYEGTVACATVQGDPVAKAGTQRTNTLGGVWTALKPDGSVYRATVRWVMEVVEYFETNGVRAAVVRGHPADLAWADFGKEPGWCVLAETRNKLVRIEARSQRGARRLARRATSSRGASLGEPDLELPLAVGRRWGGDTQRSDGFYCWNVESRSSADLASVGGPASGKTEVFTVAYRTLPDHTLVEFAPGVGVVRYAYEHHGTVASVELRLSRFSPPARSPAPRR
jgi:hypothetical protein